MHSGLVLTIQKRHDPSPFCLKELGDFTVVNVNYLVNPHAGINELPTLHSKTILRQLSCALGALGGLIPNSLFCLSPSIIHQYIVTSQGTKKDIQ